MRSYTAARLAQLVEYVAEGNPDPDSQDPVVVEIKLWDGRTVRASYYEGRMQPHIFDLSDALCDREAVHNLVQQLLDGGYTGSSFIAETGEDDMVCRLIWEIEEVK